MAQPLSNTASSSPAAEPAAVSSPTPQPIGGSETANSSFHIQPSPPSPSTTSTSATTSPPQTKMDDTDDSSDNNKYHALILDSGPIVKRSLLPLLQSNPTKSCYTVPGVIQEIRDVQTRQYLHSLPISIEVREASKEGVSKVMEFSKKTGDYDSLSWVDIQVLGLVYDLEKEGCNGNISHIRAEPKRKLGVGRIQSLAQPPPSSSKVSSDDSPGVDAVDGPSVKDANKEIIVRVDDHEGRRSFFEVNPQDDDLDEEDAETADGSSDDSSCDDSDDSKEEEKDESTTVPGQGSSTGQQPGVIAAAGERNKTTWAMLVNPSLSASAPSQEDSAAIVASSVAPPKKVANAALHVSFGSMNIGNVKSRGEEKEEDPTRSGGGGQFSDAEDDDEEEEGVLSGQFSDAEEDDDDNYKNVDGEMSDEECDVLVLDPEEAEERKRRLRQEEQRETKAEEEKSGLESEFPTLAAARAVPYKGGGSDEENGRVGEEEETKKGSNLFEEQAKKMEQSLKPITRDGKRYNSFRKYSHVVKKDGVEIAKEKKEEEVAVTAKEEFENESSSGVDPITGGTTGEHATNDNNTINNNNNNAHSRIMGGTTLSGQSEIVEDDGEGWVTSTHHLRTLKATNALLDPSRNPSNNPNRSKDAAAAAGPPKSKRAACATTDFAMQNVLLQMNCGELITIDGRKVRRLKSWVTRCGACYAVYTNNDNDNQKKAAMTRLFCDRCGSGDSMQRVAASVDGKTGRLRLHLSKKYKNNLRGTKFSLPKPGKGNRFQGDLLLREDQLLMGAWNQKLKKGSGGGKSSRNTAAQSMFGSDLATNVGCFAPDLTKRNDIKVGFGRKNPNSSKFGRERRGKKKKSTDKACGLRRY